MKIYYVDAENIGLSPLSEQPFSVIDRVFVFTNAPSLKAACASALLTCVSGYPSGPNQADFHIIAHLSKVLGTVSKAEKKALEFLLCSKDLSLWKAFEFQCALAGVTSSNPYIELEKPHVVVALDASLETKILALMVRPVTALELQQKLKLSNAAFTTSFNRLISAGKIQRQSSAKKTWLRVPCT